MRLYEIIKTFIKNDDYCSIEYFTDKYRVSKRTIQGDISYLTKISFSKGFEIHSERNKGYLLEVKDETLFKKFLETIDKTSILSNDERPYMELAFIVIQNTYISMGVIAEKFEVSKTAIKSDINEVEKIAEENNMLLEKKSHYGVRIVASDESLIKYLINEYQRGNNIIKDDIDNKVKDFLSIKHRLINKMNKEKISANYNELINIFIFLKIIVYILMKKDYKDKISIDEADKGKSDPIERTISDMIEFIQIKYNVHFDNENKNRFYLYFSSNARKNIEDENLHYSIAKDIDKFLGEMDERYRTSFKNDKELNNLLVSHITLLIERLHKKISYKNPLANQLSITYPMIFNIALQLCDYLHEKYDVEFTFDEIGFIAMHFAAHMEKEKEQKLQSYNKIGVVCSSGGGSAYMIKIQLESVFTKSDIKTFSFLEQDKLQDYEPDIIFTVIPIQRNFGVPVIYIKELLDDKDLYRIKEMLKCDEFDPYMLINNTEKYYSYFSNEFFKKADDDNYDHIIKLMADEIENKGYGELGYADLVMERESFASTIYYNGVAIPHPIETKAYKNLISVCILKNPFLWNGREVRIIFMICLKKENVEIYKEITKKLYKLMKDSKHLKMAIKVNSLKELIAVMREMEGI